MKKLTAEKCRERIAELEAFQERGCLSMNGEVALQAFQLALESLNPPPPKVRESMREYTMVSPVWAEAGSQWEIGKIYWVTDELFHVLHVVNSNGDIEEVDNIAGDAVVEFRSVSDEELHRGNGLWLHKDDIRTRDDD